jgi:ribonuclease BN (tRNA processing enzyme)
VQVGDIELRFQPVPHFLPTHAIDLASPEGRVTYSADSSPSEDLCAFARETDLLLIEATLPVSEGEGHLTPREAGEHGAKAGAKRLVLTHFSDELDVEWARAEGARGFGAPVDAAHEGATYELAG